MEAVRETPSILTEIHRRIDWHKMTFGDAPKDLVLTKKEFDAFQEAIKSYLPEGVRVNMLSVRFYGVEVHPYTDPATAIGLRGALFNSDQFKDALGRPTKAI